MPQLAELSKRIADFETQEGLLDLYYKVYKDPGTPEYTVGARFTGEKSEEVTISIRLLDPEKSTKRIHFVDIELLCKEKNITGLKRLAVRHYSNNYTYYELEYHTDGENAGSTATLTKVTKVNFDKLGKSTEDPKSLDIDSMEVTSLNLSSHGLPKQINWIRTAFMYATGVIDEPKVRNLTATDIFRQPVLPAATAAANQPA